MAWSIKKVNMAVPRDIGLTGEPFPLLWMGSNGGEPLGFFRGYGIHTWFIRICGFYPYPAGAALGFAAAAVVDRNSRR
jgi:hypothetical protein